MERDYAGRPFRPSILNRDPSTNPDHLKGLNYDTHRPRTPPTEISHVERGGRPQGKGIRAARSRPTIASVFPEAQVYTSSRAQDRGDPGRRSNSHELNFPTNNARDSLVHQMLLSLDSAPTSYDEPHLPLPATEPGASSRRTRGHTHSSSTSSGIVQFIRDRSRSQSRGRHTKNKSSGSNYQTTLDRINSVGTVGKQASGASPEQRPYTHGKARKDSTNSSVDYGTPQRQQRKAARRSMSLDQGYPRVPGGMSSATQAVESEDEHSSRTLGANTASRRGHTGSFGSANSQKLRLSPGNTTGLRRPGTSPQRPSGGIDKAMYTNDYARDGTAASTREPRMQAPAVSSTIRQAANQNGSYKAMAFSPNATIGKEKGGFFKRMFSSSKSTTSTYPDAQVPTSRTTSIRNGSQQGPSEDRHDASGQLPSQQVPAATADAKRPATLNKKPSFFRRRNKSIAAPAPPVPSLPSNTVWQENSQSREHSPASSLRQVMNPYLANSRPGTRGGRLPSKLDAAEVVGRLGDVRLVPAQDAGFSNGSESFTHAQPVPDPHLDFGHRSAPRTDPERLDSELMDPLAGNADDVAQSSDPDERSPRRKTITAGTSSATAPRRSTSKGWRDKPQTRVFPLDQSRRSTSAHQRPEVSRSNTEMSEVSDSDFASAKSRVVSPSSERDSPFPRPDFPSQATQSVPTMSISTAGAPQDGVEIDRPLLTAGTVKAGGSNGFGTLDPARTPTYAPQDQAPSAPTATEELALTDDDYTVADLLFRFNSDAPPEEPGLPSKKSEICAWLGDAGEDRARVRQAYLEMFNWKDTSILTALRKFCEHTDFKGESQQLDRLLQGIARRWTECNPNHGFKAADVVHTICYSLILLNTDLHIADIENKMTRAQFIKNTMLPVMSCVDEAAPDAFKQSTINAAKRASMLPPPRPAPLDLSKQESPQQAAKGPASPSSPRSPHSPMESGTVKLTVRRNSNEFQRGKFRLSARPSDNYAIEALLGEAKLRGDGESSALANEDCGPLVKQPFLGGRAAWETQVETVLKNLYASIQKERLPLQISDPSANKDTSRAPSSLAGPHQGSSRLGRSASISSRQSGGDRARESRPTTGTTSRWRNKMSGRPRIYAASNFSVDDDMSMSGISPSASSLWSKHSLGRTQTSMSVASFRSEGPGQEAYQQSIGFANALSQAIIREDSAVDGVGVDEKDGEAIKAASLLEDDSLELYGAPWAKEGIVKHKHHLESADKKAKERAWTECFAVIQKGWLQLFRFNSSKTASIRARAVRAAVGGVGSGGQKGPAGPKKVVGGGNWMDNALPLGRFLLRQTLAHELPVPGYSKSRPHVWALSLPNGAVHFFQAGTPEIVKEYITCANYWSARLSKEPLVGGVSNVEYGWSENLVGPAPTITRPNSNGEAAPSSIPEALSNSRKGSGTGDNGAAPAPGVPRTSSRALAGANRPPSAMHSARPSLQNSIRSSLDTTASAVIRPRLPGDHAKIAEWTPPQQSMVASALMEVDQLRVLSDYVANVKREHEKHNEMRPAISAAYNHKHPNFAKAMSNFDRKGQYLLNEHFKFSTYVEQLQNAQAKKKEVLKERDDRKKELEAERAQESLEKVETAEELRRELSRSDLRLASKVAADESEDVPDVPRLPKAGIVTKS